MMRATLAVVMTATLGTVRVIAQTAGADVQVWPSMAVTVPAGDRLEIRTDGLLQITDDASQLGRQLLRVVFVGKLNAHVDVGGGYTWTRVEDRTGRRAVEHRGVQQFEWRAGALGASVVSSRTRLEMRHQQGESAIAFRLREMVRLEVPFERRAVKAVVWSEYFHSINGTHWSGASRPALLLSFVGLRIPVARRAAIEPGYINQTNFAVGRNHAYHVIALYFTARVPLSQERHQ